MLSLNPDDSSQSDDYEDEDADFDEPVAGESSENKTRKDLA